MPVQLPGPRLLPLLALLACSDDKKVDDEETGCISCDTAGDDSGAEEGWPVSCDLRVPEDQPDLVSALAAAADGEVVCAGEGTWVGDLDFAGREVMIVGLGAGRTVLQGDGDGAVVRFVAGEGAGAGLRDLTVTGGVADGGAGVTVLEGASPTLTGLVIEGNRCLGAEATVRGVGLYAEGGALSEVRVRENSCSLAMEGGTKIYGTGAYLRGGALATGLEVDSNTGYAYDITGALVAKDLSVPLEGVSVHHNEAEATLSCVGGGLHLSGTTSEARWLDLRENACAASQVRGAGLHVLVEGALTLENVRVAGNRAVAEDSASGGAVRLSGAVRLTQADIVGNQSSAARFEGSVVAFEGEGHAWRNVALWSNTRSGGEGAEVWAGGGALDLGWCGWGELSAFSGLDTPAAEDGHLFVDPRYTYVTADDAAEWDLRLAADSPHLDAGDPALLDADGSRSDIGAEGGAGWTAQGMHTR